jgi:hypothetical protein
MSLIITFMFDPAKLQMNCAKAKGTSTRRKAFDGRPVGSLVATGCLPLVNASMSTKTRADRAQQPLPDAHC